MSYNNDLMNTVNVWAPKLRRGGTRDDVEAVESCEELIEAISSSLEVAYKKADQ